MKKPIKIALTIFICGYSSLFAQKRSFVPMAIACEMVHEVEIPGALKTYKSEIITNIYHELDLIDAAKKMLRLPAHGYTYHEKNPDFLITLIANDFEIVKFNENLGKLAGKDVVLSYSFAPVLKIHKANGELIYSKVLKQEEAKVLTRNDFFLFPELYGVFGTHKNQPEKIEEAISSSKRIIGYRLLSETLKDASVFLETCTFDQNFTFESALCSAKKNFDYTNLDASVEISTEAIMSLMASNPKKKKTVAEVAKVLHSYINLWEAMLREENIVNENAKINAEVSQGICMNLAVAYLLNNDIHIASSYVNRLPIPNDGELEAEGSFKYAVLQLRKMVDLFELYQDKIKISGS
jgi:hypothetical protein